MNDTKLKADIAEHAVIVRLLKLGYKVLKPIGDRLPYDLAVDADGRLIRVQVKCAWKRGSVFIVDSRRTKTNRRHMLRSRYSRKDFDIAIIYVPELDICYIMPVSRFIAYRSEITLPGAAPRYKESPASSKYREAWKLINQSVRLFPKARTRSLFKAS
jgi:hypothetical protein